MVMPSGSMALGTATYDKFMTSPISVINEKKEMDVYCSMTQDG